MNQIGNKLGSAKELKASLDINDKVIEWYPSSHIRHSDRSGGISLHPVIPAKAGIHQINTT
jgi:hypothetical protein